MGLISPSICSMVSAMVSSGADSPRPIWVKQFDDGLWYVINVVSTYAGVREPYSAKNHYGHDATYDGYRR